MIFHHKVKHQHPLKIDKSMRSFNTRSSLSSLPSLFKEKTEVLKCIIFLYSTTLCRCVCSGGIVLPNESLPNIDNLDIFGMSGSQIQCNIRMNVDFRLVCITDLGSQVYEFFSS